MYTLYFMPGAASLVVDWLLMETGAPFERIRINGEAGEHKRPEYLRLNPNGMVPLLLIDGRPVYEAAALALLLAERHPEAGLAPALGDPRREPYLQWMLHLANTLQPAFRRWFYPAEAAGSESAEVAKDQARQDIEKAFGRLNDHLAAHGPYVCGAEGPSAVDFHAVMLARWSRNMPRPATEWPSIAALVSRLVARPSYAALTAAEGLEPWP